MDVPSQSQDQCRNPQHVVEMLCTGKKQERRDAFVVLRQTYSDILSKLPEDQQTAMKLLYGEQYMKVTDVADEMRITHNAVTRLLSEARNSLKQIVGLDADDAATDVVADAGADDAETDAAEYRDAA